MAKKQKVELSNTPLEATTIGQIKENKHGWVLILIIMIMFIGIIYFLPNLMQLYQSYINGDNADIDDTVITNTVDNATTNSTTEEDIEVKEKMYKFAEINEIVFNKKLKFNNIELNDDILSFSVINTSSSSINLQNENLYFETYSETKTLINRIALRGIIPASSNLDLSYEVKSGASLYDIKSILEDDYTYINLNIDDNNNSVLTCTKDNEKIIYHFNDDKLVLIEHTNSYLKTEQDYTEKYAEYNNYVKNYGSSNGISTGLSQNATSLNYRMKIDYDVFTSTINNEYYFAKNTAPRVVNFVIESLLFDCA